MAQNIQKMELNHFDFTPRYIIICLTRVLNFEHHYISHVIHFNFSSGTLCDSKFKNNSLQIIVRCVNSNSE